MPDRSIDLLTGDQARDAIDASRMAWFSWKLKSDVAHGNDRLLELFGLPPGSGPLPADEFFAAMHPEDAPQVREAVERAKLEGVDFDAEFRIVAPDGSIRWLAGRGRVAVRSETGEALLLTGMNWDITKDREYEDRLEHLAMEMSHRVKNAFAVVGALVRIGSRAEQDIRAFADRLSHQIASMGEAHSLAVRYSRGDTGKARVPVCEILESALAPWKPAAPVEVDCPADVFLSEERAAAFAMLTYELATNSAKYGGLGPRGEGVDISVALEPGDMVLFSWKGQSRADPERELRATSTGNGFGTILVQHCMQTLGAEGEQDVGDTTFRFECRFAAER